MADEIVLRFSVRDDGSPVIEKVNKKIGETKKQSQALVPGLESARQSVTGFISANAALIGALTAVGVAVGKILHDHIEYADSLRTISQISGATIEETSRLVAVTDDYKISQEDVINSARALKEKGLVPTIETLAQLSDQYLAIQDPAKRYEFAQDHLGRGASKFTEILMKGSRAIREQGDAVSDALVWTQKMADDARKAEIAVDNWNDALQGLKTTFATGLLPHLTNFVTGLNEGARAAEIMREKGLNPANKASKEYRDALKQAHEEQVAATDAMLKNAEAADTNTASIEENEQAIKALLKANEDYLGLVADLSSQHDDYTKTVQALNREHADLLAEKQALIDQGYSVEGQVIADVNAKLAENEEAQRNAAAEFELAGRRRILSMLEQQLAIDGLETRETDYLLNLGLEWGVYSQTAVDEARKAMDEVATLKSRFDELPESKTITITTNHVNAYSSLHGTDYYNQEKRAAGGPVSGGGMYEVTERGRPELLNMGNQQFLMMPPGSNGMVTPMNGGGGNGSPVNIIIQLNNATVDPERTAFQIAPAVERVLRQRGL